MTRREILAIGLAAGLAHGQTREPERPTPPTKKRPLICVSSGALRGLGYAEMGEIVRQIGFDGIEIEVKPGGLVEPQQAPVDEVRAIESIHGAGLAVPVIATALVTPFDPWARTVLALAGRTGVSLYKTGGRMGSRRDAEILLALGREYKTAILVRAGDRGILDGLDQAWSGVALLPDDQISEAILPLVKAVSVFNGRDRTAQPLTDGGFDVSRLFQTLAKGGFSGPVTVEKHYRSADEPGALARDLEWLKKVLDRAYSESTS